MRLVRDGDFESCARYAAVRGDFQIPIPLPFLHPHLAASTTFLHPHLDVLCMELCQVGRPAGVGVML